MKKNILVMVIISIAFLGCSGNNIAQGIEQAQIQMVGNKPSKGFKFTSLEAMQPYILESKHLYIATPKGYKKDWSKMGGWFGVRNSDRYYVLNLNQTPAGSRSKDDWIGYHITITSSISKYTERERAIEMGDIQYIKNSMKQYGKLKGKKVTINNYGKENYSCLVIEKIKPYMKIKKKVKIYSCYKFNPSHTKYKKVTTILTYTKAPNLPTKYKGLAKQYTYADLKRRAKRMLDSLYIKDGW